ncbi:hypothetical protein EVAR_18652_1 [Eumeta japonica]|uniref:Uncharacterized protein n=1 Tax=Eumeta variegata TaxID=151549 RepID=A0A4C1U6Q9_EUMVA|nr:hypothetical protein EVAR_18652_1 [Eumeta japonica]
MRIIRECELLVSESASYQRVRATRECDLPGSPLAMDTHNPKGVISGFRDVLSFNSNAENRARLLFIAPESGRRPPSAGSLSCQKSNVDRHLSCV